ncbi:MAG: hypothetical protein WC565_07665 [Parcubacteria group bacterium]
MKRLILLALLLLLPIVAHGTEFTHFTDLAFTGAFGVGQQGSETTIIDSSGNFTIAGTFAHTGATASFTNATSFSVYTPAVYLGYDSGSRLNIAVADTTGVVAVTHTGSGATLGWTVPAATWTNSTSSYVYTPDFRVGYDSGSYLKFAVADTTGGVTVTHGGNATAVDWTVTTFGMTNATSHTVYTPSWVLGYDSGASMTIAVTDTTGAVAITHAGSGPAVTWAADSLAFTGNFSSDGTTAALDGSTSVRNISAGFVSSEGPAIRFGANATEYMQLAVTATTGATAITHTGSGAAVTWAAPSLAFTGDFSSDGATAVLDGSTSVRGVSAGFTSLESPANRLGVDATVYTQFATTATTGVTAVTHTGTGPTMSWTVPAWTNTNSTAYTTYTPSFVVGYDAGAAMTFAVSDTTGNVAITHAGSTNAVTWTAAGGFDLVGALTADAVTLSDVLTFSDGGTIDNTAADDLTITEVNIILEGAAKTNSLTIDDGSEDVKIDSDDQTATLPTITIPDFTDATADFLVTNIFTTVLPFHGGLAGEDTDAVGTNGAGLVGGGAIDVTTYDYNDGAAGANDVLVKVYDAGTTTWDDLKTAALLTAGADWAINYQLLPDADAEATGDAFAIGFDEKFCEFAFNDLATDAGAYATWGANGAKWQYSTGPATWSDLTVYDGTDSTAQNGLRPLQRPGAVSFVPPADWVVATYDGEEAYWVQCVITDAQLTQTPVIDTTNHDEPIIPFPTDGLPAPFKLEVTKVRVANMHATVHDQAIVFVVGNFTDGTFSAAQTWTASQYCDTFTLASAIACDPGDVIGILCTNDTGSTANPIWAVELTVTYED